MGRTNEDQWPAYVSVAERRRKAERAAVKLAKKGSVLSPVVIEGRKITTTFWGSAWCENLESYRDYANRLDRGRSYVRNGLVIDLQITARLVTAIVSGSSVYTVNISINEVPKAQWRLICADCSGGIDSLVELLQGRFSKAVMERICRQETGLFPKPAEIKFSCSCLDHASMCKHVAAALYGVGVRLDAKPELLFRLRAVSEHDLVTNIGDVLAMSKHRPAAGKVLEADDMAALFGLDMGDLTEPPPVERASAPQPSIPATKPGKRVVRPAPGKAASQPPARRKPETPGQAGKLRQAASEAAQPASAGKLRSRPAVVRERGA